MAQTDQIASAMKQSAIALHKRKIITGSFDDLTIKDIYNQHANLFMQCANEILAPQGKTFQVDEYNKDILHFLVLYFNNCKDAESCEIDGKTFRLGHPIMLNGTVGVGKTLIMEAFSIYLQRTNNPNAFINASVTEMLNYYKVNEHLDLFTYNAGRNSLEGRPLAYCINDVGLQTQKYFGVDMQTIVDEFFHARNEIWTRSGKCAHITTNLTPAQMKEVFKDNYGRLNDRFKEYNIINLKGESRRKK